MNVVRVLIVAHEALACADIGCRLKADPEIEIVGECADGRSALAKVRELRPDLMFLSLQAPPGSGLAVLEQLPPEGRPAIVIVTTHAGYAVAAFEFCAVDFLLKPYGEARFRTAVARAKEQIRRTKIGAVHGRVGELIDQLRRLDSDSVLPGADGASGRAPTLVIKVGGEHLFVPSDDLGWIEAQGDFIRLRIGNKIFRLRESLHGIEKRLDPAIFVRIHRSFIVNAKWIRKITPTFYGDHEVVTSDGAKLRLSRTFRGKLKFLLTSRAA